MEMREVGEGRIRRQRWPAVAMTEWQACKLKREDEKCHRIRI